MMIKTNHFNFQVGKRYKSNHGQRITNPKENVTTKLKSKFLVILLVPNLLIDIYIEKYGSIQAFSSKAVYKLI
ncbi:hypothetical protein HPP92_028752 [Vanilla planifolia]|uniref:Uncharacterized protein n=1 Tax=Vanilla planifolia TaxID=51239 RepID=A0A835P4N3_VANPL|nr:hypothetical protein HPP92_028752 [Vanilla planifolia]